MSYLIILCKRISQFIELAKGDTYYPDVQLRKSKWANIKTLLAWTVKYREVNGFHYLYGLDLIGSDWHNHLPLNGHFHSRNKMNNLGTAYDQTILLRDKFLFFKYMNDFSIPTPRVFMLMKNGVVYDTQLKELNVSCLQSIKGEYFVKEQDGQCASFAKKIRNYSQLEGWLPLMKQKGGYIFQDLILQNSKMNQLNPESVSTLRIVTTKKGTEVSVLSSLLRVGTKKSGNVDNWAAGGLAIGINSDGRLKKYGLYKPCHGRSTVQHPDTGVVFSEFVVPFYQESVDLVCRAHQLFYGIHSIGWDVAITDNGPVIIEGNDNWEISLMQACNEGLLAKWNESL